MRQLLSYIGRFSTAIIVSASVFESTSSGPTCLTTDANPQASSKARYAPPSAVTGTPTAVATESNASGTPSMFQSIAAPRPTATATPWGT